MVSSNLKFHPDAAFVIAGQPITHTQFFADIAAYQSKLTALKAGSHVVLFHPDTYQFAVRLFALACSGHNVILPPNGQHETLSLLLAQSAFFAGDATNIDDDVLFTNLEHSLGHTPLQTNRLQWPTNTAVIFYTSGSSGQSKPIVKPWRVLNRELAVLSMSFDLPSQFTFLATVSHQHIYGLLFRLLWPLAKGHIIDSEQIQYPEHIAQRLKNIRYAALVSSPAQLGRLCADNVLIPERDKIKWLFSSGGPLNNEHAETLFNQLARPATQVFGSTETGGIAYRQVTQAAVDVPWQPFNGNFLWLNHEGRLMLDSAILEQSNFPLDDRALVHKNGQFKLLGRIDRTIKIEEKRLNLDELESYLQSHDWVKEAKVVVIPAKRVQIGAVVVLSDEATKELEQQGKLAVNRALQAYLSNRFERICLPRKWRYIDALPFNSQAKLSLKTLEQYFAKPE
ncbi:acyl--CoA ligase [Pseudoalteromonas sp. Cn5-37]|uniref:AMP-binding protein n=1 Tax=Pseudoalteromonas sp. Cn5-37 TaxID=2908886 RepID=UPI001F3F479B|nr:class I adenylate-forming enzyme family protein [Pseudoalteromonas sp. Cn5-37]MCF2916195.1 acyl--CoA ligase [Pseudoalteromonas sp. Cn5-37]